MLRFLLRTANQFTLLNHITQWYISVCTWQGPLDAKFETSQQFSNYARFYVLEETTKNSGGFEFTQKMLILSETYQKNMVASWVGVSNDVKHTIRHTPNRSKLNRLSLPPV